MLRPLDKPEGVTKGTVCGTQLRPRRRKLLSKSVGAEEVLRWENGRSTSEQLLRCGRTRGNDPVAIPGGWISPWGVPVLNRLRLESRTC